MPASPLRPLADLLATLNRIDGRGYRAYKDIRGSYQAEGFVLHVDHVQGDPFADPSRVRVVVPPETSELPAWCRSSPSRRVSTADFLNREFADALHQFSRPSGSGKGGELRILRPGQEVLERTSLVVREDGTVEARFQLGLPAAGRRVLGRAAARLLEEDVGDAVHDALRFSALDPAALRHHLEVVEDAQALRALLPERGLVAFVAEGAILPRASGTSDQPLGTGAVPFQAPPELRVTLEAPHAGAVPGLGVPRGVTLVVGGGFHGKSTLLRSLERGVYDHVPGDGREQVVTHPDAVKVRAEDGRAVTGTDIRNFVDRLPGGQSTHGFTTRNASGSTSQAAALVEALEAGARVLLMDEDTSATNLLIRDARMQALVPEALEPITPYLDRARHLADVQGVSTILVCGGSGDYFDVADQVLAMESYLPRCRTTEAREVAAALPSRREPSPTPWVPPVSRVPDPRSLDPARGRRPRSIKTPSALRLLYGTEEVSLQGLEQLVEVAQGRAIAHVLASARGVELDGRASLPEVLDRVMARLGAEGLESSTPYLVGTLSGFRRYELAAFLNRIRSLRVRDPETGSSP